MNTLVVKKRSRLFTKCKSSLWKIYIQCSALSRYLEFYRFSSHTFLSNSDSSFLLFKTRSDWECHQQLKLRNLTLLNSSKISLTLISFENLGTCYKFSCCFGQTKYLLAKQIQHEFKYEKVHLYQYIAIALQDL